MKYFKETTNTVLKWNIFHSVILFRFHLSSPCTPWRHISGEQGWFCSLLSLQTDDSEWSTSHPSHVTPVPTEQRPGWAPSQFRHFGEETNLLLCKESNPGPSSPWPSYPIMAPQKYLIRQRKLYTWLCFVFLCWHLTITAGSIVDKFYCT